MFKNLLILIVFCFFILISSAGLSEENEASIIYVSISGIGNYTKIQDGIDATVLGGTIYVYNGTYYENIVIDKSIFLLGENKNSTIIDGRVAGNTIKVNADNVVIKGFTIQHSGLVYPNSGINLSSNNNLIEGNIITDNFYGLTLYFSSENVIRGNTIQNDDHCGIYMTSSSNNTIINNTIQNNNYNGIGTYYSSNNNLISGNNFSKNGYCGVNIRISSDNNVIDNNFTDNNIGIHLPLGNLEKDNYFSNNNIDIEKDTILSGNELFVVLGFLIVIVIFGFIFYRKRRKI